jgi:predicted transcriptional regulator
VLEPDRDQIEIFVDAIFRRATEGFVSVRGFYEGHKNEVFRISAAKLLADRKFVLEVAEDDARRAAQNPRPVTFCPPLATFCNKDRAREEDIAEGVTMSVECDEHPQRARITLEEILGPATCVVRSGGIWTNGDGEIEDMLHLHWRLAKPASDKPNLDKLKQARKIAAKIAGGDPTCAPINHPLRWPGSWHRKNDPPRSCEIEELNADVEIDLDDALKRLTAAAPEKSTKADSKGSDTNSTGDGSAWVELLTNIASDKNLHDSIARLAMKLLRSGMIDGATVNVLRAWMTVYDTPHDQRWADRYNDIPRAVKTAREKIGEKPEPPKPASVLNAKRLNEMTFGPIKYVIPGYIVEGLTLFAGKPKVGKSWLLLHAAFAVAEGGLTLGNVQCEQGDVLYAALEDNLRRLQSRLTKLFGTNDWPARLDFVCEMPRLTEGGLDFIKSWIEGAERPRLVIIDTLAVVRPPNRKEQGSYDADYTAVKELRDLALKYGVAIVLVHHLRKAEADDPFDTISGTLGLTGAPDSIMVIKRDSSSGTTLHAKGRDLIEIEKAVKFDPGTCTWVVLGEAAAIKKSTERSVIVNALEEAGNEPLTPNQIATHCGMKPGNVRRLLAKLLDEGVIKKASYGKYTLASAAKAARDAA